MGIVHTSLIHTFLTLGVKQHRSVQVLQRDRLVSCMLEHIDNDYAGKIQVKHLMEVEGMSVGAHGTVSLQWAHKAAEGAPPERGAAEAEFVVRCCALRFPCVYDLDLTIYSGVSLYPVSYTHLTLPTKA